ncbi:hypothetical protein RR48_10891 [Papilio machaon]|uniref:Follicle cell protein 3C-1 n=1 Tax=Papilio machaon TaxID=76193 RepID=A0A194R7T2_PAPMA|nr:hypothetical protein RR48_10891 [Papilio machaon]
MGNLGKWVLVFASLSLAVSTDGWRKLKRSQDQSIRATEEQYDEDTGELEPCQCGVFMSLQVGVREGRRGRPRGPPTGEPVVTYDTDAPSLPCSSGHKHCISKCLDVNRDILRALSKLSYIPGRRDKECLIRRPGSTRLWCQWSFLIKD